jgi:hypothetical protein
MPVLVIIVGSLLSVVSAAAPGDGHTPCINPATTYPFLAAPHPSNANTLMDSFNYLSLLSDKPPFLSLWQQVDLDSNNVISGSTSVSVSNGKPFCSYFLPMQWREHLNWPCRQAVTVCGYAAGPQNNWLITQYISRRVGGVLLPQISLYLLFELSGCVNASECRRTFVINIYETSVENNTLATKTERYRQVSRLAADDINGLISQNQTSEVNFATNEEGFYIAIQDETSCILLKRLLVFYHICPGGPRDLVMLPETIAPPIGRTSLPLVVTAQCVEGSSSITGGVIRLNCVQGGVWSPMANSGCSCNPGFNTSADRRSCSGRLHVHVRPHHLMFQC